MNHESYYKINKTSWGIRIGFKGKIYDNYNDSIPDKAIRVMNGVYFLLTIEEENKYIHQNKPLLENGILWVANQLVNKPILVIIDEIDFNPCDFQLEGLFFGIADFICSYYNVAMPVYHYGYDNKIKRYFFRFDENDTASEGLLYMNNTIEIKFRDHFRLNIPFKDKIVFEAALYEKNIPFHLDDNPMALTRYFLLEEDRESIDAVLKEIEVIASTDTIHMADYAESKKVNKLYLYVAAAIVILFLIAIIFMQ